MADLRRTYCTPCAKWSHVDGITAALRSSTKFGIPFRSYACVAGNGFHLTTKPLYGSPTTEEVTNP